MTKWSKMPSAVPPFENLDSKKLMLFTKFFDVFLVLWVYQVMLCNLTSTIIFSINSLFKGPRRKEAGGSWSKICCQLTYSLLKITNKLPIASWKLATNLLTNGWCMGDGSSVGLVSSISLVSLASLAILKSNNNLEQITQSLLTTC